VRLHTYRPSAGDAPISVAATSGLAKACHPAHPSSATIQYSLLGGKDDLG
jgi:hypothetical protein